MQSLDEIERFEQNDQNDSFNQGTYMHTCTANEAKTHFGEFLDRVQREPVGVMRHNRMVGVMVNPLDYEAMRAFYADRLRQTLDHSAREAAAAGLTSDTLEKLLADES